MSLTFADKYSLGSELINYHVQLKVALGVSLMGAGKSSGRG